MVFTTINERLQWPTNVNHDAYHKQEAMVTSMNYDAYLPGFLINDPKFESVVDIMLIIGHNHLRGLKNVEKKKNQDWHQQEARES